jgi:hypothetical protein
VIVVSGCEQTRSDIHCYDSLDDIDLSKVTIAESGLSLALLEGVDYKIYESFFLLVYNNSDTHIWIPKGYLQKIKRVSKDGNVIEILRDGVYRDSAFEIILSPRGLEGSKFGSSGGLLFYPIMETSNETETIQVEIFGFEYRDGKICDKMYPAMIEVILSR